MKIVNNMQQGSTDWLQFRATRFGSSEAAAMLGLSPYTTRTELLRIKHTGLDREFGDWFQRNVLDKGHAVEAATRPLIEDQIADTLYPAVCQGEGRLVASCDGLDLDIRLLWECKQWNEALAAEVTAGRVPDTHMPQCQHQLLVTGAERLLFTVSDGADRIVTTEVLPSPEWFQRLRDGWAQFEKDLAAYVPAPAAAPAPVGKAPDTLPALRIEITGAVTASNLAEFKASALGAIRAVNRDLQTDQHFADAEQAVKWCADVEHRLAAAKDHALSQTATIDALFKTIDDISSEARRVRLDLDKLVTRRKGELKDAEVARARDALSMHVLAVNAEISPARLQHVAELGAAIMGLKTLDSVRAKLDDAVAAEKVRLDTRAREIRENLTHCRAAGAGLEYLFADVATLVHKPADDFRTLVAARIDTHRAAEARKEAERQAAEAARIAAAEQRARDEAAAAERQRLEADARAAEQARQDEQDREDARRRALDLERQAAYVPAPIKMQIVPPSAPSQPEPATLNLGAICARLGFTVSAHFVGDVLGIQPAATDKRASLYTERQFGLICERIAAHVRTLAATHKQAAA
jgi:putative phage-type endonuclease